MLHKCHNATTARFIGRLDLFQCAGSMDQDNQLAAAMAEMYLMRKISPQTLWKKYIADR
jgi:hypothetical protein